MLYVFHGSDGATAADKALKLVRGLQLKRPDAQLFTFESDALEPAALDELVEAQGLFVERHIVLIRKPFEVAAIRDLVLERLERLAASANIFVLQEGKVDARHKKVFEKYAERVEEYVEKAATAKSFNIFALGDALGARNRRQLWVAYHEALEHGEAPESIHGTLAWAVRSMLISQNAQSSEEAGQKPFTYNKFSRYGKNYTRVELVSMSHTLVRLYHDARRGVHDLGHALERFVLKV